MSGSDRASSGLVGLDGILGGGFVRGRLHLIEGRPGTGKTTLAMQFVLAGRDRSETVLYVSMSETRAELEAVAAAHGWSLAGVELFELVPPDIEGEENRQTLFRSSEVELGETMRLLFDQIERITPARVVVDSLSEMRLLAQNPLRYRREIFAFKQFLAQRSATVLVLDDMTATGPDLQLHSLVHGVVNLEELALDYGAERRRLRVTKMRGVKFRGGYHDYTIRTGGLEVFPRLIGAEHPQELPKEIVLSGSKELDARHERTARRAGRLGEVVGSRQFRLPRRSARGERVPLCLRREPEQYPGTCQRAGDEYRPADRFRRHRSARDQSGRDVTGRVFGARLPRRG